MQSSVLSLARPGAAHSPQLAVAIVSGRAENWFFVDGVDVGERCLRAESCLLEPEIGDTVLLCSGAAGVASYILAILARASSSAATLTLPGGNTIVSDDGRLSLSAQRVEVSALSGELRFSRLSSLIGTLDAKIGATSLVTSTLTTTVGRLVQKARDSFRFTENLDETRAGRLRLKVDGRYHLEAEHAAILAEGLVKIDGEKIDLG